MFEPKHPPMRRGDRQALTVRRHAFFGLAFFLIFLQQVFLPETVFQAEQFLQDYREKGGATMSQGHFLQ